VPVSQQQEFESSMQVAESEPGFSAESVQTAPIGLLIMSLTFWALAMATRDMTKSNENSKIDKNLA
jgi:hypothetical protein